MSTNKLCFYGNLTKFIFPISSNLYPICTNLYLFSHVYDPVSPPCVYVPFPHLIPWELSVVGTSCSVGL